MDSTSCGFISGALAVWCASWLRSECLVSLYDWALAGTCTASIPIVAALQAFGWSLTAIFGWKVLTSRMQCRYLMCIYRCV